MMQVSKRVPFDDPTVLNGVRGIYIASNVIIALIYLYIQSAINKKKGACPTALARVSLCLARAPLPWQRGLARPRRVADADGQT